MPAAITPDSELPAQLNFGACTLIRFGQRLVVLAPS